MSQLTSAGQEVRVAYLTDEPGGNTFSRKGDALMYEMERRGIGFDIVYIRAPKRIEQVGSSTRRVYLGDVRAAVSAPALYRYLRETKPAIAILGSGQMGPAAVLAGRFSGVPVLPWEGTMLDRDLRAMPRRMRLMAFLQKFLYPRAPALLAPSEDMAAWVRSTRRVDPERVHVLHNPIDLGVLDRATTGEEPPRDGVFRLCAVGRLVEQKGYDVMLESMAIADRQMPQPWHLTILGEEGTWRGGWKAKIETMIGELGLEGKVSLAGHRENPYAEMARSDLFVHTAWWEPFGTVLVEALGLGLPVVAMDCVGGPALILGDGKYGRLVAPGDREAFARAVVELARDDDSRRELASRARDRAREFSPSRAVDQVLELIDVVGDSAPTGK